MSIFQIPFYAVLITPLIGLFLVPVKGYSRTLFFVLLLALPSLNGYVLSQPGIQNIPAFMGPFVFSLDRFSFIFVVILNACWAVTILYASYFVRYNFQTKSKKFYGILSVAISLITAAGMSDNLLTLYVFYLALIPTVYPLLTLRDGPESQSAGRWYLSSTLGPALAIALPTLIYINQWLTPFESLSITIVTTNDTTASLILAALILGFSMNCVTPFSGWLPKTSIAPAPVSGLIHSVGSVHVGTIAILKIIFYLYGCEYMASLSRVFSNAGWLIYLCGFTSVYTAFRAYQATDLKKRFSYSTVGQLSFVITAGLVGTPGSILGAMLHIVSHSIAKLQLFFVAGTFNSVYGTTHTQQIGKIIPNVRWLAIPIGLSGLSITGFPLLAGYYSKDLMLIEELNQQHYAAASFLVAGSIMNFLYIYPVLRAALRKRDPNFVVKQIPLQIIIAILFTTMMIIGLSIYIKEVTRIVNG